MGRLTRWTFLLAAGVGSLLIFNLNQPWSQELFYSPAPVQLNHQAKGKDGATPPVKGCNDCHRPWQKLGNANCTPCHSRVNFRLDSSRTLADTHREVEKQSCLHCHTEHLGVQGNITPVVNPGKPGFAHNRIEGWREPQGKDRRFIFNQSNDNEIQNQLSRPEPIAFRCQSCHEESFRQAHPAMTNRRCVGCHRTGQWSDTDYTHADVLTQPGKLSPGLCRRCHPAGYHFNQGLFNTKGGFDCYGCHTAGFKLKSQLKNLSKEGSK